MSEERSRRFEGVTPIADILAKLKASGKLGQNLEYARIWERWDEIAGPRLSAHGQPYTVKEGQLRVRADSAVWMHRFSYDKWGIIRRINRLAGKELVHDLFVTLEPEDEEAS